MMNRLFKSKKGVSMAMIVQTMAILFSIFMLMSTFVTLDTITNKSKEATRKMKIYVEQISQDFIYANELYAGMYSISPEYASEPGKMIEDANVNSELTTSFISVYKDKGYANKSYNEDGNIITYAIQNQNQNMKYRITVTVDKANMTSSLVFQRTYSDTIYFACDVRYEKVANADEYRIVITNWYFRE